MTELPTFPPAPEGFRWHVSKALDSADDPRLYLVSIAAVVHEPSVIEMLLRDVWALFTGRSPELSETPRHYGTTKVDLLSGNVKAELLAVATKARHELQQELQQKRDRELAEQIADRLRNA